MAEENTTFTQNLLSNDSKVSSMRLTMIVSYLAVVLVPLFVWTFLSLKTGIIPDFPPNFVWFVGTVVTVVTGGKVAQFAFGGKDNQRDHRHLANPTPPPKAPPPK